MASVSRRRGGLLLLLFVFAALLVPAGAKPFLRKVARIPMGPSDRALVDPVAKRIIGTTAGLEPMVVTAYDGERYGVVRRVRFPQHWGQGQLQVNLLDAEGRRLYVVAYASVEDMLNTANPHLLTLDADTFRLIEDRPLSTFGDGVRPYGMELIEGRLVLVGQLRPTATVPLLPPLTPPPERGVFIAEIGPRSGETLWGPNLIRSCETPIATHSQTAIARHGDAYLIACKTPDVVGFPLPGIPSVIAVERSDPANQEVHFMPGAYALGDSYYDANGKRLVLVGSAFGKPAQAVWVFDVAHRAFIGQVNVGDGNVMGAGVNIRTGRLYVDTDDAILLTTDRGIEIPQALPVELEPTFAAIIPIPFNDRVIVPVKGDSNLPKWTVYEDQLPADTFPTSMPLDYRSFDRLRTDVAQFTGDAQAFGFRVHQMGGVNAVGQNLVPIQGASVWGPVGSLTGLNDGDRDLHFGRTRAVHLSADEAAAKATQADADASTIKDYDTLTGAAPEGSGVPREWPFQAATCGDFGEGAAAQDVAGAGVRCNLAEKRVNASAAHTAAQIAGVASVGASASTATIRLDPVRGLVAEVHAEARNIVLGSGVEIGYVASDVRVAAYGRSGTSRATYTRTFRNVSAGDFSCEQCNPADVMSALSAQLGAQVRVELPTVEVLRTPGGAHGHALRDPWQHQQDVVTNNQDPTELQVPALRLSYIGDGTVASRLLLEFAATKADVTYVRLVPGAGAGDPGSPPPPLVEAGSIVRLPPPEGAPAAVGPGGIVERLVRVPGRAVKLLFAGGVRSVALWALFAFPLFLGARRRYLLRLHRGAS